jgi:hypothetical protein
MVVGVRRHGGENDATVELGQVVRGVRGVTLDYLGNSR